MTLGFSALLGGKDFVLNTKQVRSASLGDNWVRVMDYDLGQSQLHVAT